MNVLILSSTASAINYLYSLRGINGVNLYCTDCNPKAVGLYTDNVQSIVIPRAKDRINYEKALERVIKENDIDIFLPTSDHDMQGVAKMLKKGWKPDVKMFHFDPDVLELMVDKYRVINYLSQKGCSNIPKNYTEYSEIEYPVVLKPKLEGGSKGVRIANDQKEFDKYFDEISANYPNDFVVQQFIPGEVGSIFVVLLLYGDDGELYMSNVTKSTLTFYSWGGGGNAGIAVDEPELINIASEIVEKLGGWKGPINLEFKQSSFDNEYYLMEVNCRLNGYSYLNTMMGLNFPKAILELLTEGTTKKMNINDVENHSNFILNYREKVIEEWLD